jgi:putative DNA primase/helicase
MPAILHGRAADNWRPLLAIADIAGGDWPDRARRSAEKLSAGRSGETIGVILLDDIRQIFSARETDQITSADLVGDLTAMEHRPWPEWKNDKPLTQRQLARLLEPFDIAPTDLWTGDKCLKGYKLSQFADAFTRYPGGTIRENARASGN